MQTAYFVVIFIFEVHRRDFILPTKVFIESWLWCSATFLHADINNLWWHVFFSESAMAMWIKCSECKPNKWTCYLLFFSSVGNSSLLWLCGLCRDAIWSSLLPQACGSGRSLSVWNLPASECVSRMCTRASIQDVIFSDNQVSDICFCESFKSINLFTIADIHILVVVWSGFGHY